LFESAGSRPGRVHGFHAVADDAAHLSRTDHAAHPERHHELIALFEPAPCGEAVAAFPDRARATKKIPAARAAGRLLFGVSSS
jgi:hypothetical protein